MDEETMSWELLSGLEEKLRNLFVFPRNPEAEEIWEKHHIGELERENRDYNNSFEIRNNYHHDIHYKEEIVYEDKKITVVIAYHKGKKKVRVYH